MLVVTGIIDVAPEGVAKAVEAAKAMVVETRKEAGCHVYEFSQVLGTESRFRAYEEWESDDALTAHSKTTHMATFRAALGEVGVVSSDIFKMNASEKTSL